MVLQELSVHSTADVARANPTGLGLEYLRTWVPVIDVRLRQHFEKELGFGGIFAGPLLHLTQAGGKRFRPALALVACELVGGAASAALDVACAIECVHTSSLILDDLPCMDNAPERRGVPAVHVEFDEATAILTALVLFNLAHKLLAMSTSKSVTDHARFHATLADAFGPSGMIGGQQLDLSRATVLADALTTSAARLKKTSALMASALFAGAYAGGGSPDQAQALYDFGEELGCAFQLRDDALDRAEDMAESEVQDKMAARRRASSAVALLRREFPSSESSRDVLESLVRLAVNRAH